MDAVKFGSLLKELRKERELTQEQLAEKLGVTNRTVSRWETGTNVPDLDILIELSEFYQIDVKELLNGERKTVVVKMADMQIIRQVAKYSAIKEAHLMRRVFSTVVAGVVAVGSLFYTTFRLFQNATSSGIVLLSLVVAFLIYNITMQAFREARSAIGYWLALTGGFLAIILSNTLILCLFFGSGSYHNYGFAGLYYILAIVIFTFTLTGIFSQVLIKQQEHKA